MILKFRLFQLLNLLFKFKYLYFQVQEKLFNLYFENTYPSESLSIKKFEKLFTKVTMALEENSSNKPHYYQLNKMSLFNYFYAFDLSNKCLLTFSDFILGLL